MYMSMKKGQAVTLLCGKVLRADECVSPFEVILFDSVQSLSLEQHRA